MSEQYEGFVEAERLSEDEAHDEANMMRVKLKEAIGHEPTPSDYDEALEVVEELKDAAANEPVLARAVLKINKFAEASASPIVNLFVQVFTMGKYEHKLDPADFDTAKDELQALKRKAEKLQEV